MASWRSGGLFSGYKKRKTYKSAKVEGGRVSSSNTTMFSTECQDNYDPYGILNISPAIAKAQKLKPRRVTLPPQVGQVLTHSINIFEETEDKEIQKSSSPPPLLDQSLMLNNNHREPEEKRGSGDNSAEYTRPVLHATLRVLKMLSRTGNGDPMLRGTWGEIRKIAEREESR